MSRLPAIEGLKPGRIVYYVFSDQSAAEVNRRRTTGASIAERLGIELARLVPSKTPATAWPAGAQAHIGNPVSVGDIQPAMVVKLYQDTTVNLKVFLDGSDDYWATSVVFSETKAPHSWHWMFEGQATRYKPDRVEKESA